MLTLEAKSLLAAVRDNPADYTVRLLLADEIQTNGFEGAAQYIRESIDYWLRKKRHIVPRQAKRKEYGYDYVRWLGTLFPLFKPNISIVGWDQIFFSWNDGRHGADLHAKFEIVRGMPEWLVVPLQTLMLHAHNLFTFPVTAAIARHRRANREPWLGWTWAKSEYPQKFNSWEEMEHHIPEPLFRLLESSTENTSRNIRVYSTREDANRALGEAMLKFGRAAVARTPDTI